MLQVKPEEVKSIIAGFNKAGREALQAKGLHFGGEKYMFINGDETQIQGKKGAAGLSIAKSGKCTLQLHCGLLGLP